MLLAVRTFWMEGMIPTNQDLMFSTGNGNNIDVRCVETIKTLRNDCFDEFDRLESDAAADARLDPCGFA